jgi:hypothetical protein
LRQRYSFIYKPGSVSKKTGGAVSVKLQRELKMTLSVGVVAVMNNCRRDLPKQPMLLFAKPYQNLGATDARVAMH